MWRADQKYPRDPAYNASFRWEIRGPLDVSALNASFNEIIDRHDSLRTNIGIANGGPVQIVSPRLRIRVDVRDLRELPDAQRDLEIDAICTKEARTGFDLRSDPLIRVRLLWIEMEHHILLLTLHHIICDGWSIGLMMDELQKIYPAIVSGRKPSLAVLPIQYGDYVIWQRELMERTEVASQLGYWMTKLPGCRALHVPADLATSTSGESRSAIVTTMLPQQLTNGLAKIGNEQGGTMFSTTLAVFAAFLHLYTGRTDIAVTSPLAGRTRTELEGLVGLFVNNIIFRFRIPENCSLRRICVIVRDTVWEALAHQDMAFERVIEAIRTVDQYVPDTSDLVNFICQREYARASTFVYDFSGLRISTLPSKSPGALYDLNCFLVEREAGWRLSLEYKTDLYSEQRAQQMLEDLRFLFEAIVDDPDRNISTISHRRGVSWSQ